LQNKKLCVIYIRYLHFPPSSHNEKMSRSRFFLVPRYSLLSPSLFSSHRVGDYGQSQLARGQPWTELIKTYHLITSLLTPRITDQSQRHFPNRRRPRRWRFILTDRGCPYTTFINFFQFINSSFGISIFVEIKCHLRFMLSIARSIDMLMNMDITSSEIKMEFSIGFSSK